MNRGRHTRPAAYTLSPCALLLLALLVGGSVAQRSGDITFPKVLDLAIGDPCTVPPAPWSDISYARDGVCQRVRDCSTFVPRVIVESFDIRRDVCYFEVHDPVVCCVREPVPVNKLQAKIMTPAIGQRGRSEPIFNSNQASPDYS